MKDAVRIGKGELKKDEGAQLGQGETRVTDDHWDKIAAKCKGEAKLLTALKVIDGRKP